MAKLLKHLGIGVKKTGSSGSHRSDYNAQKSNSVQELLPKSPTRYRSSSSLSTGNQEYDTHSLKLFPADPTNHQRQPYNDGNNHHQRPPSYATNGRHDHRHGAGGGGGGSGSGSTRSKEQKSLSPKANCNTDAYYTSYTGIESTVPEEREVFDSLPDASLATESPSNTATPPRLLDEYCDPLDLKKTVSDGTELLGAIAPTPAIEDDYSVPYEVKKILKGVRPKERYGSSGGSTLDGQLVVNGSLGRSSDQNNGGSLMEDSFDEPWEWSAKLSALVAQNPSLYPQGNCLTPMMTPKKTAARPCSPKTDATHDGGKGVANGDIRSSFNTDMTSGSSEDDLDDPGRQKSANEATSLDRQASLSPEGTDEPRGRDPSASGEKDHSSFSKSDIVAPDRIGSVDGSSGGLLIITEIPPIIDVDPYDCHIVIPDLTRCRPDSDSGTLPVGSLPDRAEPVAVAATEADGATKGDRSFQNAAREKHDRSDLANSRSWSSASESIVSSTLRSKCSHGSSSKQNQSHHNDFGQLKSSKSTPSKSGSCTNSKSSHIAVPLSTCSNTKEKINPEIALEQQCWYHGSIGRVEAEELLQPEKEGSFLVRMSESSKLDYSLSLKSGRGFLHMKIVNLDGKFILGQFSQPFDSIPHMIEFYCMSKLPIKGSENISLIHPLASECCL